MDASVLEKALLAAKRLDLPISLHEEDKTLISQNGINGGGKAAQSLGLAGSPRQAEITLIQRDVELAVRTGAPLCIQHISTAEGVELVRRARRLNPRIHAEATPHHFSLTEEAVLRCGTLAKVNPPLRTEADRTAIIEGLADGTIDLIATDHAPHADHEKAQDFTKAPSGMIGLETAFSLGIKLRLRPPEEVKREIKPCNIRLQHLPFRHRAGTQNLMPFKHVCRIMLPELKRQLRRGRGAVGVKRIVIFPRRNSPAVAKHDGSRHRYGLRRQHSPAVSKDIHCCRKKKKPYHR
jgi:hypothetical protein